MTTFLLSCVTAVIAWLVYRVQSDRLFFDLHVVRQASIKSVLENATRRVIEIEQSRSQDEQREWSIQARIDFDDAVSTARPLFGPEVGQRLDELKEALDSHSKAELQKNQLPVESMDPFEQWVRTGKKVKDAKTAVELASHPYTRLGRRGLLIQDRLEIEMASGSPTPACRCLHAILTFGKKWSPY